MVDFVQASKDLPVFLIAYSEHAPMTLELRDLLAKLQVKMEEVGSLAQLMLSPNPN